MNVPLGFLATEPEGGSMVEVLQIETPSLGDRSYLVHDGSVGLVIDPQRDIDRVTSLAAEHGVRITHVAETHVHNDYLTGGLALARATGATYLVNEADPVRFTRSPLRDGDSIPVGDAMRVRVLATPGHTFTHLSYVLEAGGAVAGVFTGGSLLYGATGRPTCWDPRTPVCSPGRNTPPPSASRGNCPMRHPSSRPTGSAASARPGRAWAPSRPRSATKSW